jgi:hypothetical protein
MYYGSDDMVPSRRWLIVGSLFVVIVAAMVGFYFTVIDNSYTEEACYADTGLSPDPERSGVLIYVEKSGRMTLAFSRGEHPSKIVQDHGSIEAINVECSRPVAGDRIVIGNPDVQAIFYASHDARVRWTTGDGIQGFVEVNDIHADRIRVKYDIVVDAITSTFAPATYKQQFRFRGQTTLRFKPRPDHGRYAELWPKPK